MRRFHIVLTHSALMETEFHGAINGVVVVVFVNGVGGVNTSTKTLPFLRGRHSPGWSVHSVG